MGAHLLVRSTLVATLVAAFAGTQQAVCIQDSSSALLSAGARAKTCLYAGCTSNEGISLGPSSAAAGSDQDSASDSTVTLKKVFINLPGDQKAIWTSPLHLHWGDTIWVAPMLSATGVLIGSDQHSMERARSNSLAIHRSNQVANGGVAALVALPASMYVWGSWQGKPRAREAGLLSGEALVDSLAVNEAFKLVFARERPTTTGGQGKFFTDVSNASFPSTHSMLGWTAASVIAHEYPGPLSQIFAYGTAAAVSVSRVTGRQHFPSDVVVGAAAGWLIGRQVYKAHHDPALEFPSYGSFVPGPKEFDKAKLGSPFVPLDSWVYPALERLAALGYIRSQFTGLRPWTRRECRRQIEEAEYFAQSLPADSAVAKTITQLKAEFDDNGQRYQSIALESLYSGYTHISGEPLRDSYHFGKTIWNDLGRPYDQGSSFYSGAAVSAVAGPFFWYVQGEYEHAPGRAGLTPAQQNFVNDKMDFTNDPGFTPPLAAPVRAIDRFYPLDMYAGLQLGDYALTFGKQSLWLGPGENGALMLNDNADPMYTLRLSRTTPLVLPGFLRYVGELRGEILFSKLSGHQFPQRPFFNLQKFSVHPTKNLEIGFTRAAIWAGVGHPFTLHRLIKNFTSLGDTTGGPGTINDPGDRKSGFDFSYRIPGLRNWLTVYSDFYSDDDPSPIANFRRAIVNPGLYLSHLPALAKLDLRAEVVSTQALTSMDHGGTFFYWNNQYHDANTNKGNLFGNQTGRDGRTYQAWTTYHFSAMTSLQFSYRTTKTSALFLPGGGTQSDASTRLRWQFRPEWSADAFVQYERWLIPFLRPTAQNDVTGRIQLTYTPKRRAIGLPPGR